MSDVHRTRAQTPWLRRGRDATLSVRLPWTVWRFRPAVILVSLVLLAVVGAVLTVHLMVGERNLPLAVVLDAVLGRTHDTDAFLVTELRLARPLVGLASGAAFGLAGALIQRVTGNPLASPDLLGVLAGANLAIVVVALSRQEISTSERLIVSLVGGAVVGVVVLATTHRASPGRILLVGAGITVLLQAVTVAIVASGQIVHSFQIILWLVGGLYGRSWEELNLVVNALLVLAPIAFLLARRLDHLQLGHDAAVALGVPVRSTTAVCLATAVALSAVGVAAAGPLAFVGLVAPHIARQLVGERTAAVLLTSAIIGGLVVVSADLVARTILAPREVPTGVIVPMIGVPLLLLLLGRRR